ncbi:uncharacterized protein N7458_012816 [Penicillium daleae]|uniref:Uncharacterized protein n=1 Tax=Penicillium daleae TaxID=63821 RepID=A0AAD6BXA3_9EURO|nr:uncharacterized protein N7458_012816 [Penicillium daleae]KAJ5433660.1 hypothetical protein N7458_012816 [Penicillium daleae]
MLEGYWEERLAPRLVIFSNSQPALRALYYLRIRGNKATNKVAKRAALRTTREADDTFIVLVAAVKRREQSWQKQTTSPYAIARPTKRLIEQLIKKVLDYVQAGLPYEGIWLRLTVQRLTGVYAIKGLVNLRDHPIATGVEEPEELAALEEPGGPGDA